VAQLVLRKVRNDAFSFYPHIMASAAIHCVQYLPLIADMGELQPVWLIHGGGEYIPYLLLSFALQKPEAHQADHENFVFHHCCNRDDNRLVCSLYGSETRAGKGFQQSSFEVKPVEFIR
jgi:hypothetical protein